MALTIANKVVGVETTAIMYENSNTHDRQSIDRAYRQQSGSRNRNDASDRGSHHKSQDNKDDKVVAVVFVVTPLALAIPSFFSNPKRKAESSLKEKTKDRQRRPRTGGRKRRKQLEKATNNVIDRKQKARAKTKQIPRIIKT